MSRSREETLRELLARVHERLSRAEQVDAQSRRLLTQLMQDIGRKLEAGTEPAKPVESAAHERESLPRLEALAVRFEAEHPALGQVLRQLVDYLQSAGI
jgi:effector-binding domain-containing protein